jgi:hypothetical protein
MWVLIFLSSLNYLNLFFSKLAASFDQIRNENSILILDSKETNFESVISYSTSKYKRFIWNNS